MAGKMWFTERLHIACLCVMILDSLAVHLEGKRETVSLVHLLFRGKSGV